MAKVEGMTKQQLEQLADKFQQKADAAYNNLQETGMSRYDREYQKNMELADAVRMAANAKENTEQMYHFKYVISTCAEAARGALLNHDSEALEKAARELVSWARMDGLITGRD